MFDVRRGREGWRWCLTSSPSHSPPCTSLCPPCLSPWCSPASPSNTGSVSGQSKNLYWQTLFSCCLISALRYNITVCWLISALRSQIYWFNVVTDRSSYIFYGEPYLSLPTVEIKITWPIGNQYKIYWDQGNMVCLQKFKYNINMFIHLI